MVRVEAHPRSAGAELPEAALSLVALFFAFALVAAIVRFVPGPDRWSAWVVPGAAGAAALGAVVLSDAAPTGWAPLDILSRAAGAGAFTLAVGEGRSWLASWAAASAGAALLLATSPVEVLGTLGIGAIAALVATGATLRTVRAVAAGAIALLALTLETPLGTGVPSALATVVLLPVLVAGLRALAPPARRRVAVVAAVAVGICVVGGLSAGALAWSVRRNVDEGVRSARAGLSAVDGDDRSTATTELTRAEAAFGEAHEQLRAPWGRLAYVVPIVAQQVRAVDTLALAGEDLARSAVDALAVVDPGTIRPEGGQIDLAVVRSLAAPLREVDEVLDRSDRRLDAVESDWLLSPVARRHDELRERVGRASAQADVAADAVTLAPSLLGGDGPRRYLLAIYTPAESRAGGGFMGNFGELTAVDGKLSLERFGRIKELEEGGPNPAGRQIRGREEYLDNWGAFRPAQYWGVINVTNDFPTAADVMRQLYPQSGGTEVDGVIALDPDGFTALVRATGPLSVPGISQVLTAENSRSFLLHDQYLLEETSRVDFLGDASRALFERITAGEVPGVAAMARELAPAVAGRHVQLASARGDEQAFFRRIGATGDVPKLRGDSIGVTGQNYNGNKIDWFLHRELTYDVDWDPSTGKVDGALTVELRNDAPATGEPHSVIGWGGDAILNQIPVANGENLMLLSLYSAFQPGTVTLDGSPVEADRSTELGRHSTRFYVRVPPGGTSVVRATFSGVLDDATSYRLDPVLQPMANPDVVNVSVRPKGRWRVGGVAGVGRVDAGRAASATWTMDRSRTATVEACPVRVIPLLEWRSEC